MNRNSILTKLINFLNKLKTEEKNIGQRHPVQTVSNKSNFSLKRAMIIAVAICIIFYVLRIIFVSSMFNSIMEGFESAGASVGFFDEKETAIYKRKEVELIKLKKEKEAQEEAEQEKRAKEYLGKLIQEYNVVREEYSKYIDENGEYLKGVEANKDVEATIVKYRALQKSFVPILEECEEIVEYAVQSSAKSAKKNKKELEEIKYKIGEFALKGQKGLSETEMQELDKLASRVESMRKLDLEERREILLFHYFKFNKPVLSAAPEYPKLKGCTCENIVSDLWEELREDKYFLKHISTLRMHINMQEYRHIIWKTGLMDKISEE